MCRERFVGRRRSVVLTRKSTSGSVETLVKGAKYKLAWLVVDRGAACNAVALVLSLSLSVSPAVFLCPLSLTLSLSFFRWLRLPLVLFSELEGAARQSAEYGSRYVASLARCHHEPLSRLLLLGVRTERT